MIAVFSSLVLAARLNSTTVTLNNGLVMPVVSFGLFMVDDDTAKKQVNQALQIGVRNIFASALIPGRKGVAEGIKASGVARSELFICGTANTKDCSSADDCYNKTKAACAENLEILQLEHLDMIMLDYPPATGKCEEIQGQWKAFQEMLDAKKTKSIAVSNFSPAQLDCLKGLTTPAVNQMQYSVGDGGDSVVADNTKRNIIVQGWSPLSPKGVGGGSLVSDTDCTAIGAKYGKSAAQVALKWILQHNATFTTNLGDSAKYMKEDISLFDFTLSAADMKVLDAKR